MDCPFCMSEGKKVVCETDAALAVYCAFPVSRGHTLVVPRKHVTSIFDLSESEQADIWRLVASTRGLLHAKFTPDGFNVGVNDGRAAGQTIEHGHIHVIPRFFGDIDDPRGGVRWVLPEKANYWDAGTADSGD